MERRDGMAVERAFDLWLGYVAALVNTPAGRGSLI
jgi:hypothetical protein